MKKLTRLNVDQLKKEMPVLDKTFMDSVIGGGESDCLLMAMVHTAQLMGNNDYTLEYLEGRYINHLVATFGVSEKDARDHYEENGVHSSEFDMVFGYAFSGSIVNLGDITHGDSGNYSGELIGITRQQDPETGQWWGHAVTITGIEYEDDCGNVTVITYWDEQNNCCGSGSYSDFLRVYNAQSVKEMESGN